ncbi:MAG: tetratricopeptide repeat protein [Fimbriimonadaceae bacterium]|nr:tetratricopeptide repeat protein [Fimbriimonadaceae bacterium]
MRIAVLPFNAAPGADQALARQLGSYLSEILRASGAADEIGFVQYMQPEEAEDGTRFRLTNPAEGHNEAELLENIAEQGAPDVIFDGLLTGTVQEGSLEIRRFERNYQEPQEVKRADWVAGAMTVALADLMVELTRGAGGEIPDERTSVEAMFQTGDSEAVANWLRVMDAVQYLDRSQGRVVYDWTPKGSYEAGQAALKAVPGFETVAFALVELARRCFNLRLGTPDMAVEALDVAAAQCPESPAVLFQIGSFFADFGDANKATTLLERASRLVPDEPAVWTRLGMVQLQQNMPVNAERSLKKAIELQNSENFDPTPYDVLTHVLGQTGREHEIEPLFKGLIAKHPQSGPGHARYAQVLLQTGKVEEAKTFMDQAMGSLDDNLAVKRVYAPLLRDSGDFDRAMDFYEEILEDEPQNVPLMLEYADTLMKGDRAFEAEKVLRDVIEISDPQTRAQAQAWLIELEQPKRVEMIQAAQKKADDGDVAGALADLKPLRNWLQDYWKLWALLATLHNRVEEFLPAEEAAKQCLTIFPGCEPAVSELANSLGGQKRHDEAFDLMRQAIQAQPGSIPIAIQYGLAAKRVGQTEEARNVARQLREALGDQGELEQILAEMEG